VAEPSWPIRPADQFTIGALKSEKMDVPFLDKNDKNGFPFLGETSKNGFKKKGLLSAIHRNLEN
jgi:hypothetical protein